MGYLAGVMFIAQRAGTSLRKAGSTVDPTSFRHTMGWVALALLILVLIGRLPVVGPFTVFLTTIAGIGACVLEWQRRRAPPPTGP